MDALCISIVPQAQVLHTTDQEIEHYERNIAARIVSRPCTGTASPPWFA